MPHRRATPSAGVRDIGFFLSIPHLPAGDQLLGTFWVPILQGAEREARKHGASIMYRPVTGPALDTLGDDVSRTGLDAALLVGATPEAAVRDALRSGRPTCLVDTAVPGLPVDAVLSRVGCETGASRSRSRSRDWGCRRPRPPMPLPALGRAPRRPAIG